MSTKYKVTNQDEYDDAHNRIFELMSSLLDEIYSEYDYTSISTEIDNLTELMEQYEEGEHYIDFKTNL